MGVGQGKVREKGKKIQSGQGKRVPYGSGKVAYEPLGPAGREENLDKCQMRRG